MPPKKITTQPTDLITGLDMTQKKATTTVPDVPVRLVFAQAINNLSTCCEHFTEAVNVFNKITPSRISELDMLLDSKKVEQTDVIAQLERDLKTKQMEIDMKLDAKKVEHTEAIAQLERELKTKLLEIDAKLGQKKYEYDEAINKLERDVKNKQLETENQLKEFHMEACKDIAASHDYTVITTEEYTKLETSVKSLESSVKLLTEDMEGDIKEHVQLEKKIIEDNCKHELTNMTLNHRAETAELLALTKQQEKEITVLNAQIENMKYEIGEQRKLTKEIANASSKSQINQSFGKEK